MAQDLAGVCKAMKRADRFGKFLRKPKAVIVDGHPFASPGEALRYTALRDRCHEITHDGDGIGLAVFSYRLSPCAPYQREAFRLIQSKRNKFGAVKATVDGITFHSKREARRYTQLIPRVRAGQLQGFQRQVPYVLTINGVRITEYRSDFEYTVTATGERIVEDSKGFRTPDYVIKRALMRAVHNIVVTEV